MIRHFALLVTVDLATSRDIGVRVECPIACVAETSKIPKAAEQAMRADAEREPPRGEGVVPLGGRREATQGGT